jgi:hypothetical protein
MVHFYDIICQGKEREVKTLCQSNILAYTALLPTNFGTDSSLEERYFMCKDCLKIRKERKLFIK